MDSQDDNDDFDELDLQILEFKFRTNAFKTTNNNNEDQFSTSENQQKTSKPDSKLNATEENKNHSTVVNNLQKIATSSVFI